MIMAYLESSNFDSINEGELWDKTKATGRTTLLALHTIPAKITGMLARHHIGGNLVRKMYEYHFNAAKHNALKAFDHLRPYDKSPDFEQNYKRIKKARAMDQIQ